jgi:hypothetical protein
MRRATGEALLAPPRNRRSKEKPYNRYNGKSVERREGDGWVGSSDEAEERPWSEATLLFVLAIRELGSSLFLYTSNTMVMSVLLLDYYEGGNLGKTAAFSLVQTVLLGVLIGGANWLSREATQGSVARAG